MIVAVFLLIVFTSRVRSVHFHAFTHTDTRASEETLSSKNVAVAVVLRRVTSGAVRGGAGRAQQPAPLRLNIITAVGDARHII